MKFSKQEVDILKNIVTKMEEDKNQEQIRISQRRKSQLKGNIINKLIQKKKKQVRQGRKITKKRSSIP